MIGPRRIAFLCLCVCGMMEPGCASDPRAPTDPAATLKDQDATTSERQRAVVSIANDLREGKIEHNAGREALKRIAWRRSSRTAVRLTAIDALLEDDGPDTARMLGLLLPTETNWDVIARVGDLAVQHAWRGLAPALVRSWSRKVVEPVDADRPERAALAALFPDETVEAVVYRVFATPKDDKLFGDRARLDAWALLQRIDRDGSQTRALLAADTTPDTEDPLLADLHAGARLLGVVPRSAEQLRWLREMRLPEHRAFWSDAVEAVASLDDSQTRGLALRHISAVVWARRREPTWLTLTRDELASAVAAELHGARKHPRTDGVLDFTSSRETLDAWRDRLSWGDFLLLRIANRAIKDPHVDADLFVQALRDRADTTTEYGGVLDQAGDGFRINGFSPRPTQRLGDRRFVASAQMISASAESLFHYHFHVQRERNADFAGPGRGDLEYADTSGRACLVFTSVEGNVLNADYYQPGGARIDLGEVRQPVE